VKAVVSLGASIRKSDLEQLSTAPIMHDQLIILRKFQRGNLCLIQGLSPGGQIRLD
jgi:hypothetical protein